MNTTLGRDSVMYRKVTLSEVEQGIVEQLAKQKHQDARDAHVKNARRGPQSDYETDLEGVAGEFAFCKLFNLYPRITNIVQSADTDSYDATMGHFTVDVKTTKYETGHLVASPKKGTAAMTPDFYALMVGSFPTYSFRGFMTSAELLRDARLQDMGYMAKQHELRGPDALYL